MIRTQVYLDPRQLQAITILAKQQKKDKAKVIRGLIQKGLEFEKPIQTAGEALLGLAELGKKLKFSGPTDLSTNHDTYLYEEYSI